MHSQESFLVVSCEKNIPSADEGLDVRLMTDMCDQGWVPRRANNTGVARIQKLVLCKVHLRGEGALLPCVNAFVLRGDPKVDVGRTETAVIIASGENGREDEGPVGVGH